MIADKSGLSAVGMALLRRNLDKLTPPSQLELHVRGDKQVLVVTGPEETFESSSFGWGRADDHTKALSEALDVLGWQLPLEEVQALDPEKDHVIKKL